MSPAECSTLPREVQFTKTLCEPHCLGRVMLRRISFVVASGPVLCVELQESLSCLPDVIMTLESTVPLPSLGRFHSSAPHNVTPDTVQRKRSTYMEKREIKDTCFLTRHPHIFQTSIGLGRGTATQGGMMMKISSLLSPGSGNILSADMGMMGREVGAASQESRGLGRSSTASPSGQSSV